MDDAGVAIPGAARRRIDDARAEGLASLTEDLGLDVLDALGVPTLVREGVEPPSAAAAVQAAGRVGYPVALKGVVPGREHKTGRGLVQARIGDPASLGRAASAIERAAGPGLRAFLVEEWVDSPRELACGLVRDASFGPCVMAGFGGVHAEIVDDTCFRAAPVSMGDALAMLEELRSRAMLGAYRGGRPADREAIARILVSLGRLGLACPEVSQVDINPLIVRMDGTPVAVDALIVLGD